MPRKKELSAEEKRLRTMDAAAEEKKRDLVERLQKTPIIQIACERADISRSTYYGYHLS
jgi:hypothetical protein